MIFALFFKTLNIIILTEELESTCPIVYLLFLHLIVLLLLLTYFEQNGSFYMQDNQ